MNEKSKSNGDTALHIASRTGHVNTIKVLMKESLASPVSLCGSYNVEARNNAGQTALDVAKDENVRNLLKTYMTESVISTIKFRMPSQDTTLANARHELCRVATQNNRRVAPFLFVRGVGVREYHFSYSLTQKTHSIVSTLLCPLYCVPHSQQNRKHQIRSQTRTQTKVLGGFDGGILIRPQQEHDFTLEQVAGSEGFIRVRVFRRRRRKIVKEKKMDVMNLKMLADLACEQKMSIEGDGLKNMVQHVAQAATSPQVQQRDEEKKEEEEEEKEEEDSNS